VGILESGMTATQVVEAVVLADSLDHMTVHSA
jgi:hypothetical protein